MVQIEITEEEKILLEKVNKILNEWETEDQEMDMTNLEMDVTGKVARPEKTLKVYRKKATYPGAPADAVYYSAVLSDGTYCTVIFKCDVLTQSKAFEIGNAIGTVKQCAPVEVNGQLKDKKKYYITACDFFEIVGEELPF